MGKFKYVILDFPSSFSKKQNGGIKLEILPVRSPLRDLISN